MFEFDVYQKVDGTLKGRLYLAQSGVMATSAFEAVRTYIRDEKPGGKMSDYTARRASLNSKAEQEKSAW